MNTDIYLTKNESVDLTKCYFMLCKSNGGSLLLRTIYTCGMEETDTIFHYDNVKKMNCSFSIKNDNKRWDNFKTFKGFINRINKDINKWEGNSIFKNN